jgi:hypothetical protein
MRRFPGGGQRVNRRQPIPNTVREGSRLPARGETQGRSDHGIGVKDGRRIRGTHNRPTRYIQLLLDPLECGPVKGMARIATDVANPVEIRTLPLSLFRKADRVHPDSA